MPLRRTGFVVLLLAAACAAPPSAVTVRATPATGPATGPATASSTASATASSTGATPGATPSPSAGEQEAEGALSVLTLDGYTEWGGSDPKVKWLSSFEEESGCKVSLRYYDPSAVDADNAGAFDVVSASPALAGGLIEAGKVAPLAVERIPGYHDLTRRLRELAAFNRADKVYGVPYLWGVHEVFYDSSKTKPENAAEIFADKGPVMFEDTPLSIADAALALKADGREIEDPFQLTQSQFDDAVALFEDRDPAARSFWRDPIDVVEGFATGTLRLAQGTPFQRDVLARGGKPVKAVKGGPMTGWADAWMVSSSTAHPGCAYRWLDWSASAEIQRKAAGWVGLAPANPGACTGGAKHVCDVYPKPDDKNVYFASRPAGNCGGGDEKCAGYAQWVDRWSRVTG